MSPARRRYVEGVQVDPFGGSGWLEPVALVVVVLTLLGSVVGVASAWNDRRAAVNSTPDAALRVE